MRLLMCYMATHPEKMEDSKRDQWVKLGGLSPQDMEAVNNLAYLGVQVMKQTGKGAYIHAPLIMLQLGFIMMTLGTLQLQGRPCCSMLVAS